MANALLFPLLLSFAAAAQAQLLGSQAVTIIVPTPAAGTLDTFARVLSPELALRWKVPVVVENRPGAGTALGAQAVARAKSDGHTLLMANNAVAAHGALSKLPLFDAEKDLQPLTLVASSPYFLIVPEKGVRTLDELTAEARANPGKLNFAIIPNSQQHIDTVRLLSAAGISAGLIPYSGNAPITTALLAHEVDAYLGTLAGLQSHFEARKLMALATTGSKSSPHLPAVPTLRSRGIDLEIELWYAVFVPAGVKADTVAALRKGLVETLASPEVAGKIKLAGFDPQTSSTSELGQLVSASARLAREVVRAAHIQPQ